MSEKFKVYTLLSFAMIFWGASFVITKQVLVYYEPFTIVLFRFSISSLLLIGLNMLLKNFEKIKRKDIPMFILLAVFQPFLYFIGENYGLKHASSTAAAVIISTIPLFTAIAAFIFLKQKSSVLSFIGILISILGIFLVILKPDFSFTADASGILLFGLAVFSAVAYSLYVYTLSDKYNVLTIIAGQNIIGSILFLPMFFIFDYTSFKNIGFKADAFIYILELAVFASTLSYAFFVYAIKKIGVTKANIFANIMPIFTAIFAYYILKEELSLLNILGIFVVLGGVLLAQLSSLKNKKATDCRNSSHDEDLKTTK